MNNVVDLAQTLNSAAGDSGDDLSMREVIDKAIQTFLDCHFSDGQPISNQWFYAVFGIEYPSDMMLYRDAKPLNLKFAAYFKDFSRVLLTEHKLALKTNHGQGTYQIVPAEEQVEWAEQDLKNGLRKVYKKAKSCVLNVRVANLNAEQRKAQLDAFSSIASMDAHTKAHIAAERRRNIF